MVNELSAGGEERKTRVRLPKNRRRNQILDAAEEVFSDRGYEVATIAEVAVLAGTAEGNVYRYFETKRDLLASVIARWYEAAIAELDTIDDTLAHELSVSSEYMPNLYALRTHIDYVSRRLQRRRATMIAAPVAEDPAMLPHDGPAPGSSHA